MCVAPFIDRMIAIVRDGSMNNVGVMHLQLLGKLIKELHDRKINYEEVLKGSEDMTKFKAWWRMIVVYID